MKKIIILVVIIICFPTFTFAQEIYGSIKMWGQPVAGVNVIIKYPAGSTTEPDTATTEPDTATTDRYGSYSIHARESKCTLIVQMGNNPSFQVTSDNTKARYNFVLEIENNQYKLRRVY